MAETISLHLGREENSNFNQTKGSIFFVGTATTIIDFGGIPILGVLVTMNGDEGIEAVKIINPEKAIPIHYNDYDVFKSPPRRFQICR